MSHLAWLDTSESDRRRMLHVIDLFQQKGTVDELGIGGVRDTIADWLSPGTSTIQTRARYFFFIPWTYLLLERRNTSSDRVASAARSLEIGLSAELGKSSDPSGTIGIDAGPALKRLPSAVYWAGLRRLGFRIFDGHQDSYHRRFGAVAHSISGIESENDSRARGVSASWNPHIPDPPDGFPKNLSHALTKEEATFFADQIALHAPESLLHFLVDTRQPGEAAEYPWDHPGFREMGSSLQSWLSHSRCYSDLMHGAALLYNLMLAQKRRHAEWEEFYGAELDAWIELIESRRSELRRWVRNDFWALIRRENPRSSIPAERFSDQWIDAVLSAPTAAAVRKDRAIRDFIEEREYQLKGPRARLKSAAHLELWGGASGIAKFDYRWGITRTIATDIVSALGER